MEIKDLRVGNIVFKGDGNPYTRIKEHEVTARDLMVEVDCLSGISMPPALLVKFGFKEISKNEYVLDQFTAKDSRDFGVRLYFNGTHLRDRLKIHEFQNIYYYLTEKEIINNLEHALRLLNSM